MDNKKLRISIDTLQNSPSAIDLQNASFTVEDILSYGKEYDAFIKKNNENLSAKMKFLNSFKKQENDEDNSTVSPYGRKKISWMTLYEKVIRKIINPFTSKKFVENYITIEEIENRINVVILKERNKIEPMKKKEKENFIPKLMKLFEFDETKLAKSREDILKKETKYKDLGVKRTKTLNLNKNSSKYVLAKLKKHFDGEDIENNSTKEIAIQEKENTMRNQEKKLTSLPKLKNFNLDRLQKAYDNINSVTNINFQFNKRVPSGEITNSNISKFKSNAVILSEKKQNMRDNSSMTKKISKEYDTFSPSKQERSKLSEKTFKQKIKRFSASQFGGKRLSKDKNTIQDNEYQIYKEIPSKDYSNYKGKSLYTKIEKLAYKDELNYFVQNDQSKGFAEVESDFDKNLNNILHLINFSEDNPLMKIDNVNDLAARGERIADYKRMGDDIFKYLILDNK